MTWAENRVFGLKLSEFHTGYRVFRRDVLESVNFAANSDSFIFDQEIIAQVVASKKRIAQVPVPTRYFPAASSASFIQSSVYGLSILWLLLRFGLHEREIVHQHQFDSLPSRYSAAPKLPGTGVNS